MKFMIYYPVSYSEFALCSRQDPQYLLFCVTLFLQGREVFSKGKLWVQGVFHYTWAPGRIQLTCSAQNRNHSSGKEAGHSAFAKYKDNRM